jgi:hypothetical protein
VDHPSIIADMRLIYNPSRLPSSATPDSSILPTSPALRK